MMVDESGLSKFPEYQYHLKDHLGNVRLTFSASPETESNMATLETVHEEEEYATFLRYAETTKINSMFFDHTNNGDTHYAIRLNGSANERIGLAKSLAVMTGDTVRAEVYAKYLDPDPNNWTIALQNLMSAIAGGTAPTGTVIEAVPPSGGDGFPFAGLLDGAKAGETGPQAYLNILVFDENLAFVDGAFVPVTTAAMENGSNVPHEKLSQEVVVQQPGYVYIYLSNDNDQPLEVFFDDFTVEHAHSAIVQTGDYYPFGLTFNSYRRELGKLNEYLYQGKERSEALGWDDFHARMYSPALGRFFGVDPKGGLRPYHNPFMAMGNNPISNIDPDGEFFFGALLAPVAGIVRGISRAVQGDGIGGFFEGFGEGIWNGMKIDAGSFAWDSNLNFGKNMLAVASRFTWEAPQQFVGNLYNAAHNATGQVDWVRYKYGATVTSSGIQRGGITFGSYITGRGGAIQANENNPLFQHEYGHVLQSRTMGLAYFSRIGLPSFADIAFNSKPYGDHDLHPVEQDANARAFEYFNENVTGFYESPTTHSPINGRGWDFGRNPVAGSRTYLDYRNPVDLRRIRNSRVRSAWYDYLFPGAAGIYNAFFLYNP